MRLREYRWRDDAGDHAVRFAWVPGTDNTPFLFGDSPHAPIDLAGFHIMTAPVTQAFWVHVMGTNPAVRAEPCAPVENVSWHQLMDAGGLLDRLNTSAIRRALAGEDSFLRFRLPSETEWEYAARGGPHWRDGFVFSGSNDPDAVAWYGPRWLPWRAFLARALGPTRGWQLLGRRRFTLRGATRTRAVATKSPNQLGLYDMSGNVWEWCEDVCTDDLARVPTDGRAYVGPGAARRLRGGCHHNWDLHCTVAWRYGIAPEAHDGDIGVRLVFAAAATES
jgi:formylglycine-generating enzyme required for sulfatase activity